MSNKLKKIHPDIHFRLLNALEENPHMTQRDLAKKLGISLGGVNYCLKALIEVGHIKMNNFEKNVDFINFFLKVNNTFEYKYTKRFNRLKIMIV